MPWRFSLHIYTVHIYSNALVMQRSVLLWVLRNQRFKKFSFGLNSKAPFFHILKKRTGFGICSVVSLGRLLQRSSECFLCVALGRSGYYWHLELCRYSVIAEGSVTHYAFEVTLEDRAGSWTVILGLGKSLQGWLQGGQNGVRLEKKFSGHIT